MITDQSTTLDNSSFSRWLRTYRLPLAMTGVFLLVLVAFAAAPDPGRAVGDRLTDPQLTIEPPQRSPCVACGLGQRCDEVTGVCEFVEPTPIADCAPGSEYDPDEGFCIPEPTPEPTPVPSETLSPDATPRITPEPDRTPDPTPPPDDEPPPETQAPPED